MVPKTQSRSLVVKWLFVDSSPKPPQNWGQEEEKKKTIFLSFFSQSQMLAKLRPRTNSTASVVQNHEPLMKLFALLLCLTCRRVHCFELSMSPVDLLYCGSRIKAHTYTIMRSYNKDLQAPDLPRFTFKQHLITGQSGQNNFLAFSLEWVLHLDKAHLWILSIESRQRHSVHFPW